MGYGTVEVVISVKDRASAILRRFARMIRRPHAGTYWNGEPAICRRVVVIVGVQCPPSWWCAGLVRTARKAVEVVEGNFPGGSFFIDDDDGSGWRKVTVGRGAPFGPYARHRSLPGDSIVVEER